jgi:hypothetical protein
MMSLKLESREKANIATVQGILPQLANLQDGLLRVRDRWDRTFVGRGFAKLLAEKLDYLPGSDPASMDAQAQTDHVMGQLNSLKEYKQMQMEDPELAQVTADAITVHAQAQAALMASSGTRNFRFVEKSEGHIPAAIGNFGSMMTDIEALSKPEGPYMGVLDYFGVKPKGRVPRPISQVMPTTRPGAGGAGGGGVKYFSPDKTQYWQDGKTYDARTGRPIGG